MATSHSGAIRHEQPAKKSRSQLVDTILQYGAQAFDPSLPETTKPLACQNFKQLIDNTSVLTLMPALNLLVQPGRSQPWLHPHLISALVRLPLRPGGVQHTVEFILSVHPSTSGANVPQSTGRGASITHEALDAVSRLLSSPPAGMDARAWFDGIAPQVFALLQGEGEPGMENVAAYVIGFGILGRKKYGAPNTPGWNAFVSPILQKIDPTLGSTPSQEPFASPVDNVIDLSKQNIIVSAEDVAMGIRRLNTLVTSHPHPSLTRRLLRPILASLWSLSYWPRGNDKTEELYRKPTRSLLQSIVQLSTTKEGSPSLTSNILFNILQNLTFSGRSSNASRIFWQYKLSQDGGIQISKAVEGDSNDSFNLPDIDERIGSFISFLEATPDLDTEISSLFIGLCSRWFSHSPERQSPSVILHLKKEGNADDPTMALIEAKVMQKMMTSIPNKLVENSRQVLELVEGVLTAFKNGTQPEEVLVIALSLLNMVATSPSFRETPEVEGLFKSIKSSLLGIGKMGNTEISSTARNILLFLDFHQSAESEEDNAVVTLTDRQIEDRKQYRLAMSYITASDSPPPVRAEGLELVTQLINAKSPIIDIPALLVLLSSLLQDGEEYIYLSAIRSLIQLSKLHPKAVLRDLIDRYVDPTEESELDQRLRLGEALLQAIQTSYPAFVGETSKYVCNGLLFVAGRRGHRPKSEQEQQKRELLKERMREKQHAEAKEAWGETLSDVNEILGEDAEPDEDIISQIVTGWESRRGVEDVRIRASALSILGTSIESNVEGIGSTVISTAVDTSIHILTLEPEPERGILRRSAILLIMSFVRALDAARADGKKLGFGFVGQTLEDIQRILAYVESTDNDGLVRQHARDVIEGLGAWQMNGLVPRDTQQAELHKLAGLSVTPGFVEDSNGIRRPRIEEVE